MNKVTVTKIPPTEPTYELTIRLTEKEAITFRTMMDYIGGCPDCSTRGVFNQIRRVLNEAGVKRNKNSLRASGGFDCEDFNAFSNAKESEE